MFTAIRRKLHAGRNAHGFCLARPMDNSGYIAAVEELGVSLTRAETLATQEFLGHDTVAISVQTKAELRQTIQESLGIISDLGEGAAIRFKDLSLRISAPRVGTNHRTFLTAARSAVEKATAQKDILMKQGMPEGLVGEVTTALAAYEHAVDNKSTGRSAHVGASADLLAVTDRIMQLIQQLDALNRLRFRDDPEMLAAWRSAHDIDWPHPAKQDSVPGSNGPTPAV